MKTLYFDLIGGISGDMSVGALLDLGASLSELKSHIARLGIGGVGLKKSRLERGHVSATKFDVLIRRQRNFSLKEIRRLVAKSGLGSCVKKNILGVYDVLARAETKAHGHAHQDISFEEVGDVDSVVDIAASCICLNQLGAEEIMYSTIPVNNHIAPATFEMFSGKDVFFTGIPFENVTPTGMGILAALGRQAGSFETAWRVGRTGYGAGSLDSPAVPNVLRVAEVKKDAVESDEVFVIEANIDDMNPQFFDHVFDKVLAAGALDIFAEHILMKKTRPAVLLRVLAARENLDAVTRLLLAETTTTGVRFAPMRRIKLAREISSVDFRGRKVRVKRIRLPDGAFRFAPEYDDCKKLASSGNLSITEAYDLIKRKAQQRWPSQG